MIEQLELDGIQRRDAGVAQAYDASPDDWKLLAKRALREVCAEGRQFTADDLWDRVPRPPEPRALAGVLAWAKSKGLCYPTDRTVPSRDPIRHARPIRVWAVS